MSMLRSLRYADGFVISDGMGVLHYDVAGQEWKDSGVKFKYVANSGYISSYVKYVIFSGPIERWPR